MKGVSDMINYGFCSFILNTIFFPTQVHFYRVWCLGQLNKTYETKYTNIENSEAVSHGTS